jgi:competence protein ComEA
MVQVAGAVKNPGVYTVKENQRAQDIIKIAGGPLSDADLEKVNLVAKVKDGKRIFVPHKKPPKKSSEEKKE